MERPADWMVHGTGPDGDFADKHHGVVPTVDGGALIIHRVEGDWSDLVAAYGAGHWATLRRRDAR